MIKCRLGDVAKSQTGPFGSQLHEADYVKEGTPIVTVEHLGDTGFTTQNLPFVSEKDTKRLSKFLLEEGDIVFSRVGAVDRNVYVKKEQRGWLFSGRCIRVRCDKNKVNPRFLSFYFKLPEFKKMMLNISVGATMPSLNTHLMDQLPLCLPNMDVQNRIASLLDAIDLKIENNKKINSEIEKMEKTIYDYWFLQFEFPNEEGEPYRSSGGRMVWNEFIKREIPAEWSVCELKDAISLEKGISYTRKNIESGEGVPMINLASIDVHRNYKPNELKYFQGTYNVNKEVHYGDMLIACTDLTRNADIIGSPILVPNDNDKYLYSMDLAKLTVTGNQINPLYLYMTLRTDFYHNYIKGFASGTNVLHLNTEGIVWFRVCIPSRSVQDKFAIFVDQCHNKSCEIIKENQELTSLRDFLLPLLMNGQVSFKE